MSTALTSRQKIYALLLNVLFILALGTGLYYYSFTKDNSESSHEQSKPIQTPNAHEIGLNTDGTTGLVNTTNNETFAGLLQTNATSSVISENAAGTLSQHLVPSDNATNPTDETENITATLSEKNTAPLLKYSTGQTKSGGEVTGRAITETSSYTGVSNTDSWVRPLFIESLAQTLVSNYWPKGTHPSAQQKGIISLSLRHINSVYATKQTGLGGGESPSTQTRQQILQYAFTPSMLQHIYYLYADALVQTMTHFANQSRSSGYTTPLTQEQTAEMFSLYAQKSRGLSGACTAYASNEQIPSLLNDYANAQQTVIQANLAFIASTQESGNVSFTLRDEYLKSIALREQSKINIASAMRLHGNTTSLDADELIYIAAWLARREPDAIATTKNLASLFADSAILFTTATAHLPKPDTSKSTYEEPHELTLEPTAVPKAEPASAKDIVESPQSAEPASAKDIVESSQSAEPINEPALDATPTAEPAKEPAQGVTPVVEPVPTKEFTPDAQKSAQIPDATSAKSQELTPVVAPESEFASAKEPASTSEPAYEPASAKDIVESPQSAEPINEPALDATPTAEPAKEPAQGVTPVVEPVPTKEFTPDAQKSAQIPDATSAKSQELTPVVAPESEFASAKEPASTSAKKTTSVKKVSKQTTKKSAPSALPAYAPIAPPIIPSKFKNP